MASRIAKQNLPKIGPYEIIDLLGAGGTSHIYKGCNTATGEIVAIKVPQAQMVENPVFLKRFEQEFGVARLLEHPHLVRVIQFGRSEENPYIVMEFIEGQNLGDRIHREGALPESEALHIIAAVASALHAAHKRKIIHRDVKPDNILLATDGRIKLTDLGLAKDGEADHDLTRPLRGMGTPNFMAPEQFNDAKHADTRCDIYSLAATLYMAVTGQAPFKARGNLSIWKKKLSNDLTPPRQLTPNLSERVERVIIRAMSPDPNLRPVTCRQFIQELRGAKPPDPPATKIPHRRAADRRASVRFVSKLKGTCRPLAAERKWRWSATIRDISASGVGLILNRRFEPGTVLRVKLPGSSSRRLYLVRVVRVETHSARTWLVGCIFPRRLSDEEVKSLL
ncbi:MAG TPA: serine/threonine-protein kinase [Gemmataceae bacterium]|nr:serine/threonine-protein kinase [Gemmataceae bacterium]